MPLKVEFRSLIVKHLVILFSEITALMKFPALEIEGFAIWVNLNGFFMIVCLDSVSFKTEYGRNVLVLGIQYQWELSRIT